MEGADGKHFVRTAQCVKSCLEHESPCCRVIVDGYCDGTYWSFVCNCAASQSAPAPARAAALSSVPQEAPFTPKP